MKKISLAKILLFIYMIKLHKILDIQYSKYRAELSLPSLEGGKNHIREPWSF